MYLRVNDDITDEQLKAIAEVLGIEEVEFFYNVHYETCRDNIRCAIENLMDIRAFNEYKQTEEYRFVIEDLAGTVYYNSDFQWDGLYEKAEAIAYSFLTNKGLIDEDDI